MANIPTKAAFNLFVADLRSLKTQPTSKKYAPLLVEEFPFDAQLLALSSLYRQSRQLYVDLGGIYRPRVCSVMRSLSATDLISDEIEYTPCETELVWLSEHHEHVFAPQHTLGAVQTFSGISLFHEQNHRIVWRLVPKIPHEPAAVRRYLNFAESLVVMLDLALGDELGPKLSPAFERIKSIYRPAGRDKWASGRAKPDRAYLQMLFYVTYLLLSGVDRRDIQKSVDYVFPNQAQMARVTTARGLDLSELFTQTTNREWQRKNWESARAALAKIQKSKKVFEIVGDPLDFEQEFAVVNHVLDVFGIASAAGSEPSRRQKA